MALSISSMVAPNGHKRRGLSLDDIAAQSWIAPRQMWDSNALYELSRTLMKVPNTRERFLQRELASPFRIASRRSMACKKKRLRSTLLRPRSIYSASSSLELPRASSNAPVLAAGPAAPRRFEDYERWEDPGRCARRRRIELGSALPHRDPRALGDLIGFLRPRSRLDEKTLDARSEVIEQGLECLVVAVRCDASDQLSPLHL